MHIISLVLDFILVGYIGWEVIQDVPRYRQLKQAIANGDTHARTRIYHRALVFEWGSTLLALMALGFDWSKLNPKFLALGDSELVQHFSKGGDFNRGAIIGMLLAVTLGFVGMVVARIRANRRAATTALDAPTPRWRRFLPDFSALIPVTIHERLLFAAMAISAGICEEIVFRGWLLAMLHSTVGLDGTALVLIAAAIFGLAHAYQGITGTILIALLGAVFCLLYIETGSLLIPILLHILVDLRFALLPAPRPRAPQLTPAES